MQVIKPMMPIILDFTGRPLQPIGDGLAVAGEHRTGGGEFHAMRGALHQSRTALCLQLFDLLADALPYTVALAVAENEPYCSICHNVTNDWG